jgi:hypothetical protein
MKVSQVFIDEPGKIGCCGFVFRLRILHGARQVERQKAKGKKRERNGFEKQSALPFALIE